MKTGKGPIALSDEARDRVPEQLHARYVATIVERLREVGTLDLAAADLPIRVVDRPIDDFRTDPSLDLARYVRDVLVDRATYLDERSFRLDFTESDFNLDDYILHGDAAEATYQYSSVTDRGDRMGRAATSPNLKLLLEKETRRCRRL